VCWRVALGARGGDAVVGCVLRRGHGGGHLGGAQVNRGRGRRYPRRRVSTDPRGSDDLLSFAVAVEIRCGGGPGERSSAAATEDARRASRAVSAVVRNRTGARVAGGSWRWRAALKQMLPRHGCAPVPEAELCRRPPSIPGALSPAPSRRLLRGHEACSPSTLDRSSLPHPWLAQRWLMQEEREG
jgi:hypothetical protein